MNGPSAKPAAGVSYLTVDEEHAGRRIDNFLGRILKGVPKGRVYRMLRRGEVRVNGGRVGQDYRLETGDRIRIPPHRQNRESGAEAKPSPGLQAVLRGSVLLEDEALLIIDKPAGLPVHGGSGVAFGVIEALRSMRPELGYLELAHRLDRDTSGCLVLAKQPRTLRALHDLFRGDGVEKRYRLLVAGRWIVRERLVAENLRKNVALSGERMVQVAEEGKLARTVFTTLDPLSGATFMEARLLTGRTHQIRVHAAHAGHPLAGDTKYGDAEFNRRMRALGLQRLFLHASRICLALPGEGRVAVEAPLPTALSAVIERLRTGDGQPASRG